MEADWHTAPIDEGLRAMLGYLENDTPLAKVFSTPSEFHMIAFRAKVGRSKPSSPHTSCSLA